MSVEDAASIPKRRPERRPKPPAPSKEPLKIQFISNQIYKIKGQKYIFMRFAKSASGLLAIFQLTSSGAKETFTAVQLRDAGLAI